MSETLPATDRSRHRCFEEYRRQALSRGNGAGDVSRITGKRPQAVHRSGTVEDARNNMKR